jgi:hypothetical protein
MAQKIQVKDLTVSDEEAESAVLVYFEDLQGTVHIFPAAVEQVSRQSVAHFKAWCQRQGLDYETMTEEDIDRLLENALAQVRASR